MTDEKTEVKLMIEYMFTASLNNSLVTDTVDGEVFGLTIFRAPHNVLMRSVPFLL